MKSKLNSLTSTKFLDKIESPNFERNSLLKIIFSQGRLETKLILKNPEQLLLTLIIPTILIISLNFIHINAIPSPNISATLAITISIAIISNAFTGQAIAIGFDRRYGALQRLGATNIPIFILFLGKIISIFVVVILQIIYFNSIALLLGFHLNFATIGSQLLIIILATMVFTVYGFLLGGIAKAEIILALANIIWFILLSTIGIGIANPNHVPQLVKLLISLTPGAITANNIYDISIQKCINYPSIIILLVWFIVGLKLVIKYFKISDNS